jgi:RNA polymerase sigma-70 factor (ECF subfamily)
MASSHRDDQTAGNQAAFTVALPEDATRHDELLVPAVYHELRRLAHSCLRGERPGHTLQATALVHEAYLRLIAQQPDVWNDRSRFMGIAAHLMRQILVEYARSRSRQKRGGKDQRRVPLEESMAVIHPDYSDRWDALDRALDRLSMLSARQTHIVELRYFGGLTVEETAALLGLSEKTVKRDWAAARAWLRRELDDPSAAAPRSGDARS